MEDKLIYPKNITSKHILRANIEVVWELLVDPEFIFKRLMGDVINSYESNNDKLNKIGTETILHFDKYDINYVTNYLVEETYYKKINMHLSSNQFANFLNQNTTYTLISDTMEGSTVLVCELEFEHPEKCQMTSETLEEYKKNRSILIRRFAEHLAKTAQHTQYESIMINSTRQEIWDVITNWSVLRTISPCVADEIEFTGDQLTIGSQIKLIFKVNRNFICNFKVAKVRYNKNAQDCEYRLVLNDSTPKIPYQEIQFIIVFLSESNCFLTFQHLYKEVLDIKMLNDVSIDKKKILQDIKNYLEK